MNRVKIGAILLANTSSVKLNYKGDEIVDNSFEKEFASLFKNEFFALPIRWDGNNFYDSLKNIFDSYCMNFFWFYNGMQNEIHIVCNEILTAVEEYLDGHPEKSYEKIHSLLSKLLEEHPLWIYKNNYFDPGIISSDTRSNKPKLYRMAKVTENKKWDRKRLFHTPFDMRSKIATTRYSIAGVPSLYLSTSLDLCEEELNVSINTSRYIASRFEIADNPGVSVKVIEMGIKPSDFFLSETDKDNGKRSALLRTADLKSEEIKKNYYLWYPLIAACSYIRVNKDDPFSVEYIIPQLVTQAIREIKDHEIWGIRYFSCSSMYASELGFNYVFPTSGTEHTEDDKFCLNLAKAFTLTMPLFKNEYKTNKDWEMALRNMNANYIDSQY